MVSRTLGELGGRESSATCVSKERELCVATGQGRWQGARLKVYACVIQQLYIYTNHNKKVYIIGFF